MSESHGYPYSLSFRLGVAAGLADEVTVGGVWGPAVVEQFSYDMTAVGLVLRAYAMASRVPVREGIAPNEVISGDVLFAEATDSFSEQVRTGIDTQGGLSRLVEVGRVVPWGPWWLVVRVENAGGAFAQVIGTFRLTVLEGEGFLPVPSRRRRVGWWHQGRMLEEGNPDGLVAGYRGGV